MPDAQDRDRPRIFVGIGVPPDVAARLIAAAAPVRARYPDARWIPAASLHLTLAFFGDVAVDAVDAIVSATSEAASRTAPFTIGLRGGGGTARAGRPGVAWLAVDEGTAPLARLAGAVAAAAGRVGPAPADAHRPYRGHLTLARRATPELVAALADEPHLRAAWVAAGATVYRSLLGPGGSRYQPLATAPFREQPPV